MKALIVTGTDTGIGKTIFSAGLAGSLAVKHGAARYWKPVQAGLEEESDSAVVARLAPSVMIHKEAWRLRIPASPHHAAHEEGVEITADSLTPPDGVGPLVIEGAGGVLVPLAVPTSGPPLIFADLFARWGAPVVVVARTGLGTINHSLMTIEVLRARACNIAGIAFVGPAMAESESVITAISGVRRLGRLPLLALLDADHLAGAMLANFDLAGLII